MSVLSPWHNDPPRTPWLAGLGLIVSTLLVSAYLFLHVVQHGAIGQPAGGETAGAYYHVDAFSAYILLVLSACYLAGLASALPTLMHGAYADRPRAFLVPYLASFGGMAAAVVIDHLPLLILSLEATFFSFYFLVGWPWRQRTLFTSFQYGFLGGLATLLLVAGAGLIHASTGSFFMAAPAGETAGGLDGTGLFGLTLFVFGLLLKLGAFPLHVHLPRIFLQTPPAVALLYSTAAVVLGIYVLVKVVYAYVGAGFVGENTPVLQFLAFVGMLGILLPSLIAWTRDNVRELLLYVMLAQVGYILAALSLAGESALTAGLLHLVAHVVILGSLWLALTQQGPGAGLEGHAGLARRRPLMAFCALVAALSLVGLPLTSGFVSKWYLLGAALQNDAWMMLIAMLAGILITAGYAWRLIESMYLYRGEEGRVTSSEAPPYVLIPLLLLTVVNIYLGIDTRYTVGAFELISANLAGAGQ